MSDSLINSLNDQVQRLQRDKDNLSRALKAERNGEGGTKALKAELDTLRTQVATLEKERDGLKQKAEAAPSEKDAKIKELEGQIAARDFRAEFDKAALAGGAKQDKLDDLYRLSGLKPGDGPAKPEDFADYLASAKEARSWAFGEATDDGGSSVAAPQKDKGGSHAVNLEARPPASGNGRGASVQSANRFKYSLADVAKPGWQQTNPALVAALNDGTALCTDT